MAGLVLAPTPSAAGALFIVNQPWVRPAKTAQTTEAYMNLTSTEGARLVAVRTDAAKEAAIRAPGKATVSAPSVRLPAGTLVALAPGHYRLVLKQLIKTLELGDRVPMTLRIDLDDGSHQDIVVNAEVRLRSPIDDERRAHSHAHSPH
jgi:copper(I)-binding protein